MTIAPQGSEQWHKDRLGKVTASEFEKLLKNPQAKKDREAGKFAKTAQTYMRELIAEVLTGEAKDTPTTKAMEWGHTQEPFAVKAYEARTGNVCTEVGFVDHPTESRVGGSPDRLVGDDGGLEIKCPYNSGNHIGYLLDGVLPDEHEAQVQGSIWINKRKWWDFGSYDPRIADPNLGLFIVHVERDDDYIDHLRDRVGAFRDQMIAKLKTIMKGLNE